MNSHRERFFPKKKFGQNFLRDPAVIDRIIRVIDPEEGETILEIGPGLGALTARLAGEPARLEVIEIDADIVAFLRSQSYGKQLIIHHQDVLNFPFATLAAPVKIVGNLPYNISTPLLIKLISTADISRGYYFMLQKEVAHRLAAAPGNSSFGRLSVLLQYFFQIEILFPVEAAAFDPPPKVESAFIKMMPKKKRENLTDMEQFTSLVKKAFGMKRKTLYNNLKGLVTGAELAKLGINPNLRPEALAVRDFVTLSNYLVENGRKL